MDHRDIRTMTKIPKVFVGNIGLRSVTLCGQGCKKYLGLPHSKLIRKCTVIEFGEEDELIKFVQSLIDDAIPFESGYKSDPARDALYFRSKGKLRGNVVSFDWSPSGAIYEEV